MTDVLMTLDELAAFLDPPMPADRPSVDEEMTEL
jgi:hypothetical protein